ncbi:hypothetical protein SELMODRAFT_447681 [Selaginella moellendorffii]|uniref:Uncharacterized protein n=1 Tax=Selaginella moellendorffii TaxID=88036 RepID=D8T1H9_SELML|nr:hypothetical protein SELMODRAFT_447681 [Selaginella moellendorffii]
MKTKAPGKAREDGEATKAGKEKEDKQENNNSKPESLEPIVQEIPLLPPFGSDEELIEYATAVVKETPWRQLYTKLAVLVKAQHVPEIIKDSPVVFSFFMWVLSSTDKSEEMLDQMPTWIPHCCDGDAWLDRAGDALKLFLKMEELGVKYLKTLTFNCDLQFDMVHKRMTMMRKMNALTTDGVPDTRSSLVRAGSIGEAYQLFAEMMDKRYQAITYILVQILNRDGKMNASTDTEAMTKLKEKGKFEGAGTYLDKLSQQKLLPSGKGKGSKGRYGIIFSRKCGCLHCRWRLRKAATLYIKSWSQMGFLARLWDDVVSGHDPGMNLRDPKLEGSSQGAPFAQREKDKSGNTSDRERRTGDPSVTRQLSPSVSDWLVLSILDR